MTKAEKEHLRRVAEIGCIACWKQGTPGTLAQLHHIRETAGMGQRASNFEVLPLCHSHHLGTHHPVVPSIHLDRTRFIEKFGTELELLELVRSILKEHE